MGETCKTFPSDKKYDVIIVGAGTAGATIAIAFAKQGRQVALIEKNLSHQDRIVGELLQPGGIRALEKLGISDCAIEDCDSIRVDGYTIILPQGISTKYPSGTDIILHYPEHDPMNFLEKVGSMGSDNTFAEANRPRGRSFHNINFVRRLRSRAAEYKNIDVIEGIVTNLIEEGDRVEGVHLKHNKNQSDVSQGGATMRLSAPLTVIADGIWSSLRKCTNRNKPHLVSYFIGLIVSHPPMEAPVPHRHFGHVILSPPSPILIYQISSTETRVLVDYAGDKLPSVASGDLKRYLVDRAQFLPETFRQPYLESVERGDIKSMPNRSLITSSELKEGSVLIGDALNMRHPLTGGGMTVALKDAVLLTELLDGVDFHDTVAVQIAIKCFHQKRAAHASTINVLANALYSVFTTSTAEQVINKDDVTKSARMDMQESCFEYLSLGGLYAAGPIGLLSGLTPSPTVLAMHFFMVAFYGMKTHLLPFGFLDPSNFLRVYRLLLVACGIIMPLLELERSTPLSWFPVRKTIQLLFPWEHMRWCNE